MASAVFSKKDRGRNNNLTILNARVKLTC